MLCSLRGLAPVLALLMSSAPAWAQEAEAPPPVETAPTEPTTPTEEPAPTTGETTEPAPEQPPAEAPAAEVPATPAPRFDDEDPTALPRRRAPAWEAEGGVSPPAPAGESSTGKRVRLRTRSGEEVDGTVVAEAPEGWAVRLPTGETRFYDRLDVVDLTDRGATSPGVAQKALLLFSLLWPGAGQVVYAATVQKGGILERSALFPGIILAVVGVGSVGVLAAGLVVGRVINEPTLQSPVNPVTLTGAAGLTLAFLVALLDAGARMVLD
ncbi:MAG: hypothetical protein AB2A00_26485 [Myxococcota bacterium]